MMTVGRSESFRIVSVTGLARLLINVLIFEHYALGTSRIKMNLYSPSACATLVTVVIVPWWDAAVGGYP